MRRFFTAVFLPLLPAILSIAALAYDLYTWEPHYESGAGFVSLLCLIVSLICLVKAARLKKKRALVWLLSLAICMCVVILAERIPFCPECDQITYDELGIFRHWISADWWQ